TAANPYSVTLVVDVVALWSDPTTAKVDLFSSPDFHDVLWLLAPVTALALAALRARFGDARGRRADAALLFLFAAATCVARRYGTLLVGLEIAIAAPIVNALPPLPSKARAPLAGLAAVLATVAVLFAIEPKDPLRDVPVAAARLVVEKELPD